MKRIMTVCAAVAALALAALIATVPASASVPTAVPGAVPSLVAKPVPPAGPDAASCGRPAPPDRDGRSYVRATTAVNIRTGSSTGCTAVGAAQPGDLLDYYCYTAGTGGTWTYLRDTRTGVRGWALDANLPANGSSVYCGF